MTAITSRTFDLPASPLPRALDQLGASLAKFARFAVQLVSRTPTQRRLTRAEEAEQVRELARQVESYNRGFADDLYAAAARHEGFDE
jgi:hypothetical protein